METSSSSENFKNCYDKREKIGLTTFGEIYKAYDKKNNRPVILKIIDKKLDDEGPRDYIISQIYREKEILTKCKGDFIIELYSFFETESSYIFVFEYFENDLETIIKKKKGLKNDLPCFKQLVISLANALIFLNENKIIHRDIKPRNIFIEKKNHDDYLIKLGNFSVSTYINEKNTEKVGTLLYMAPEMVKEELYDEKIDLWSLGMTLYESFFGKTPFGSDIRIQKILDVIYSNNIKMEISEKPKIINLDILFRRLLTFDPKERMSLLELLNYVYDEKFLLKNENFISNKGDNSKKYNEIYQQILKSDGFDEDSENHIIKESIDGAKEDNPIRYSEIGNQISNFDLLLNINKPNKEKINNIIYYEKSDQNDEFQQNKLKYCEKFERRTKGAFIYCTDENYLFLVMKQIKKEYDRDKRIKFNLIVQGKQCENVINILQENNFYCIIEYICIYCRYIEKYSILQSKYPKIKNVFGKVSSIQKFIEETSSENIKPFMIRKFITFDDYKNKYFERHKDIIKYYGELDFNLYKEQITNIKKFIHFNLNFIKDEDKLNEAFEKFGEKQDLKLLDELVIKEYSKSTLYGDLNKWMFTLDEETYKFISYFSARLMYHLNSRAEKNNKFFNEEIKLYRGTAMPITDLLPYLRQIGKVILFSSFTSTSKILKKIQKFSKRKINIQEEKFQEKKKTDKNLDGKFSVLFKIFNKYEKGWKSSGIDIEDISKHKKELEVLFQPFTYYKVIDVNIDIENECAYISLQVVGKTEIIEKRIKFENISGDNIKYDEKQNLIIIQK